MSRIGKKIIAIPEKTEVKTTEGVVTVKGPLGELKRALRPGISVTVDSGKVTVVPKNPEEESAYWGTVSAHISNMIEGVQKPFVKKLVVEGIGYKSEVRGDELSLALGFSHPVKVKIPKDLKVTAEKNVITVTGIDIELVGAFAARVRDFKKPEPYKGKGIRYENEVVRRKQGKKTA